MREDIIGSLRNALERGASLEQAIQSFISAGYREVEVREAAKQLQPGVIASNPTLPQVPKKTLIPLLNIAPKTPQIQPARLPSSQPEQPQTVQIVQQTQYIQPQPKRRIPWLLISLVSILFILVTVLVVSVVFREQITDFIKQTLG